MKETNSESLLLRLCPFPPAFYFSHHAFILRFVVCFFSFLLICTRALDTVNVYGALDPNGSWQFAWHLSRQPGDPQSGEGLRRLHFFYYCCYFGGSLDRTSQENFLHESGVHDSVDQLAALTKCIVDVSRVIFIFISIISLSILPAVGIPAPTPFCCCSGTGKPHGGVGEAPGRYSVPPATMAAQGRDASAWKYCWGVVMVLCRTALARSIVLDPIYWNSSNPK